MDKAVFIAAYLVIAILVLAFLDYRTTKQFLATGKGREANPFMAWVQWHLPRTWGLVRVGGALVVCLLALWLLPVRGACVALFAVASAYLITVLQNYQSLR
jgi:hypothetical protein